MNLPRRRRAGQTPERRQTRITYRCLTIDLHEDMPGADVDLATLDIPILAKARDLAPSYPATQIRILEIRDAMVFRYTWGRFRVATWLDAGTDVMWVCAADERDDDTYDFIIDLHLHDELLPSDDDSLRQEVEAAARFATAVQEGVPTWLDRARAGSGQEHVFDLPGGSEIRLFVRTDASIEEIWLAMPTLTASSGITARMRGLVLATVGSCLPECVWEQRYDWPAGALSNHEIAHLGLREL